MSAIAWWALPIVATVLAIVYVTWRGRPRPPEDTHEAMQARERFRRAIENVNVNVIDARPTDRPAGRTDGADRAGGVGGADGNGGADGASDAERPGA